MMPRLVRVETKRCVVCQRKMDRHGWCDGCKAVRDDVTDILREEPCDADAYREYLMRRKVAGVPIKVKGMR